MEEYKPTTIVLDWENDGVKFILHTEIPWDSDINDMGDWFRKVLHVLGYHPDNIRDVCPDSEDEMEKCAKCMRGRDDDEDTGELNGDGGELDDDDLFGDNLLGDDDDGLGDTPDEIDGNVETFK